MDVEVRDDLLIQAEAAAAEALKNPGAGRRIAEDVAARARECGAAEALVVALRAASWSARELYDHAAAEDLIAEAIEVAQDSALRSRLSEALVTRSTIHLEQGRVAMARRDIVDARHRALDENLPDVMFAEALLEGRAGNLRDAETAYARVVEVTRDRRPDITAKALNNWAIVCQKLGDLEEAEVKLRMVIDRAASFSDVMVAIATHNLAGVMGDAGRVVESLRLYDEAQERFESAGMTLGEHYLDKTQTLLSLRLLDEASRAVERAVAALDTPGASLLLAEALIFQARIAHEQGDFARSVEATDRASDALGRQQRPGFQAVAQLIGLEARVAAGDVSEEVVTALEAVCDELARTGHLGGQVDGHVLLGRVSNAIGDRERARASFMTAANAARRGPILTRLQGKLASASAAAVDGNVRALSRHARAGLDDLERYRGALASSELRARAAAYGMELAEMGLRAALRARRPLGVWAWLERTRASAIGGVVGGDRSPDLDPLLAQMREIRSRLRSPAELESDQQELYAAMTDVERRIREVGWQRPGSGTAGARPVTEAALDDVRQLHPDRVVVEFGSLDGEFFAVVASASSVRLLSLGDRAPVDAAMVDLGFALSRLSRPRSALGAAAARASADDALEVLSNRLLEPTKELIAGVDSVVVVPPSALFGLPWGALAAIADRSLRIVPTVLASRPTARPSSASKAVAIAGPDLDHAEAETAQVASAYRRSTRLIGDHASARRVLTEVEGADVVHLACHGTLRADSPTFSGFRLADGPLTVHDIEGLTDLAGDWVLAACDLGRPGTLSGPDLEGVLAALLGRGTRAVVAAVTPVPDETSSDLMVPLHDARADGSDLADALRFAKDQLDPTDPRAFVTKVAYNCYGAG